MRIAQQRRTLVEDVMNRVRVIAEGGIDRSSLARIKGEVLRLAARRDLFPIEEFPAVESGTSSMYRLSEDPDHRFALYVNVSRPGKSSAPHNHTTWAVVVGVRGEELNRLYRREDDGSVPGRGRVTQTGEVNVAPRGGIRFLPDDIHSIHVVGGDPILHFHMYGRGLEQLTGRIGFDTANGTCKVYPPHRDIRVAR